MIVTFNRPEYFVIDLQLKKIFELGNGSSRFGLSLTLMPGYDPVTSPYILCKESECYAILDPLNNIYTELYRIPQYSGKVDPDPTKDETIVMFAKNPNVIYSEKEAFYLARYEIHPHIVEAL